MFLLESHKVKTYVEEKETDEDKRIQQWGVMQLEKSKGKT